MARLDYERLGAESAALLARETSRSFAHCGSILIFEPGPLVGSDGGVDFQAIRGALESRLHLVPLYRRRLRWIPFENHPVWVDDRDFNLDYHVRHTSLARPGGTEQLLKLAARILSQRLDRARPLWECWVLEGLEGRRFALVLKVHLAMVEGPGADLLEVLLAASPGERHPGGPPYQPRPVPSVLELVRDEVVRQARLPRRLLRRLRDLLSDPEHLGHEVLSRAHRVARLLGYSIRPLPETPLDGRVGPHRRVDHLTLALRDAKAVRAELGGTLHDVILATVAGAAAEYLRSHFLNPATLDFRIAAPVALHAGGSGAGITEWILELPIWERDPSERLARIRQQTEELHREEPGRAARDLLGTPAWTSGRLLALGARAMSPRAPVNLSVVNVPGPQRPLYLHGAKLAECFGHAPLRDHTGLGITVLSYDGKLCWGLNADYDRVPDLPRFTAALANAFRELVKEASRRRRRHGVVRTG